MGVSGAVGMVLHRLDLTLLDFTSHSLSWAGLAWLLACSLVCDAAVIVIANNNDDVLDFDFVSVSHTHSHSNIRFSLYRLRYFQIKIQFQHFHSLNHRGKLKSRTETGHHPNKYLCLWNGRDFLKQINERREQKSSKRKSILVCSQFKRKESLFLHLSLSLHLARPFALTIYSSFVENTMSNRSELSLYPPHIFANSKMEKQCLHTE